VVKNALLLKNKSTHKRLKLRFSPVGIFEQFYSHDRFGFIYESLEHKGERGRYSFVGGRPFVVFKSKGYNIEINTKNATYSEKVNPIVLLREMLSKSEHYPSLATFGGGAVGYIAYDAIRFFENIPDKNLDEIDVPDINFIFPSELIIFDHKQKTIDVIVYNGDSKRVEELVRMIEGAEEKRFDFSSGTTIESKANFTKESFCEIVEKAKEHILAGDIFQVVLSQRLAFPMEKNPLKVFEALRITNPSPYMYYLRLNDLYILGSSPETLVKLLQGEVTSNPIAGTRPRGATDEKDRALESELLVDEKELAEHIMLVDLARNDLGRVCTYGSVKVNELMKVDRYSKVMHISSNVTGRLKDNQDAFHVLQATFPAGTVSGAPKIRAMEIIDELEPVKRGIYAGAIGYFSFDGNMDLCIAIRTIVIKNKIAYIQGGAGIVADSVAEREYVETLNKISALEKALEIIS
jgi:anthranilate synthase component 1